MRRFGNIFISVTAVLLPLTVSASFSDVPTSHPNFSAINYVQLSGIVQGYADGTYGPSKTINRAEFTKILIAARYSPVTITSCTSASFDDTPASEWFSPYVCVAFNQGIIGGYADGTFRPINNVNMGEAAKIIVRAFDLPPVPTDDPALDLYRSGFAIAGSQDEKLNPYWWQYYLVVLNTAGALPSSYRGPDQAVTRAEMAEMIYRVMNRPGAASSANTVTPVAPTPSSAPVVTSSRASTVTSPTSTSYVPDNTADLSLKYDQPDPLTKGDPLSVEYTVKNHGPGTAQGVEMIGTIESKYDLDTALSDPRCRAEEGSNYNVYCYLGAMEEGDQTRVTIAQATSRNQCPITLTQDFSLKSSTTDSAPWDNSAEVSASLKCSAAELVNLTAQVTFESRIHPDTRTIMTYRVINSATPPANNVKLYIRPSSGLVFVPSSSTKSCVLQSGDIVCTIGLMYGDSDAIVDIAYDATCATDEVSTTVTITTSSQNQYPLTPHTYNADCY